MIQCNYDELSYTSNNFVYLFVFLDMGKEARNNLNLDENFIQCDTYICVLA